MKNRFSCSSPAAAEGALTNSNYSTERSPTTALLFEATRTVILPRVNREGALPSAGILETRCKVDCSVQEHSA